ncbi:hasC1, partial [Symbiodinium pilosum]
APMGMLAPRSFVTRSLPRLGHNLEDHFDFAEYMCRMHSPIGEYLIWGLIFSTFIISFGPLLHSNYYFTGRFLPKDQGNSQLCDDSWLLPGMEYEVIVQGDCLLFQNRFIECTRLMEHFMDVAVSDHEAMPMPTSYRRFNSEVVPGCALVCGTDQGLYARARRLHGESSRRLLYRSSDGKSIQLDLDDETGLRETAQSVSTFAYIAGCVLELGKHFRVSGAEIVNYKSDLPIKKGLSSSAAICVLIVRAEPAICDLKLTVHGEMDIAYRGEINTPSRCGRLDQCVAFGRRVRACSTIYMVVVDLCAKKDTKEILKCLNEAYPFPRGDTDRALHALLGEVNQRVCWDAQQILAEEKDGSVAAQKLGEAEQKGAKQKDNAQVMSGLGWAAMTKAQERWDEVAVPLCPHELTAPTLHRLLTHPSLKPHITGGKGVGSQGDGSAQLVCRSEADQEEVVKIVKSLGMEPLKLTIPEQKAVRTAIIPIAGACPGIWPATKCVGPWLFPVRSRGLVKPAIAWQLTWAGLGPKEKILLVVNHTTEVEMTKLFKQREEVSVLNAVGQQVEDYDEVLLSLGLPVACAGGAGQEDDIRAPGLSSKMNGVTLSFMGKEKPSGIRDALLLCEREVSGEPFLLAWGDHFSRSTSPENRSVVAQLLEAFNGRPLAAMHCVDKDSLHQTGVYSCKEPPSPLPPPLGPRASASTNTKALWPLARLAEKPTREFAEEHLVTPVLPEGSFLTSFGQYVLTSSIFRALRSSKAGHFTQALDQLRQSEGMFGVLIEGMRWDLGTMQTYVQCLQAQAQDAQLAVEFIKDFGIDIIACFEGSQPQSAYGRQNKLSLRLDEYLLAGSFKFLATEDFSGPRLLDATSTNPLSGALTLMTDFNFLFDEVALRGPGPLALVRLADSERGPAMVVDTAVDAIPLSYFPGMAWC